MSASAVALWSVLSTAGFVWSLNGNTRDRVELVLAKYGAGAPTTPDEDLKLLGDQVVQAALQSQLSSVFLVNATLAVWATAVWFTKCLFLGRGRLTVLEQGKLAERMLKFLLLKVVFFGAAVNPTPSEVVAHCFWFLVLAFLKGFVSLARDRCEALLSNPRSTLMQHTRCLALLVGILAHDVHWIASYLSTARALDYSRTGAVLLWVFDAVVIAVEAAHALVKYGVHAVERWRVLCAEAAGDDCNGGSDNTSCSNSPWAARGAFLYYLDLITDLALHGLTLLHYAHLWWLHGGLRVSLTEAVLFLDVRHLAGGLLRRLRGHRRYLRLTHLLEHALPDANADALAQQDCTICLDKCCTGSKQLPCGHVFHLPCLRAWLQQSKFSCPLCRADLALLAEAATRAPQLGRRRSRRLQEASAQQAPQLRQRDGGRQQLHQPEEPPAASTARNDAHTDLVSQRATQHASPAASVNSREAVIVHRGHLRSLPRNSPNILRPDVIAALQQAHEDTSGQQAASMDVHLGDEEELSSSSSRGTSTLGGGITAVERWSPPRMEPSTLTTELVGLAVSRLRESRTRGRTRASGSSSGNSDEDDVTSPACT